MILIDGAKVYADVLGVMLGNHLLYGLKEPRLEIDRQILRAIRNVEPVDAAKVVRCKDCKYWHSGSCEYPEHVVNSQDYYVGDIETEAEHFCGYAERREETT